MPCIRYQFVSASSLNRLYQGLKPIATHIYPKLMGLGYPLDYSRADSQTVSMLDHRLGCPGFAVWLCCSRKYPYPSHRRYFSLNPSPPLEIPLFKCHTFLLKNWAFETPLPLGISDNLPWGGYGYFLELDIHCVV